MGPEDRKPSRLFQWYRTTEILVSCLVFSQSFLQFLTVDTKYLGTLNSEPNRVIFKNRANSATYAHPRFDERRTKFYRNLVAGDFGSGPAYTVFQQTYDNRGSPQARQERSKTRSRSPSVSPVKDGETLSLYEQRDQTPAPTDYTPRIEVVLKKEPGFAPQQAERFKSGQEEVKTVRPHSYEDPNLRTFRRSNSGSFGRAKRFKIAPENNAYWQATILKLKENF